MNLPFEQMYQLLSAKHGVQLEAIRKSIVHKLQIAWILYAIVILPVLVLSFRILYGLPLIFRIFIVPAPIALILYTFIHNYNINLQRPYISYFRENVAGSFVELVNSNLSYSPEPTGNWPDLIMRQYHLAKFESYHPFSDSDRPMRPLDTTGSPGLSNFITGEIEGRPFQLCCMSLKGFGNDTSHFKGLFVSMKVSKPLYGFIKVERKIRGMEWNEKFIPKEKRRKMDNAAFEKDFFVGSNDQITAMQYLTADVMELILNFKNELIDIQTRFNRDISPQNPNLISLDFYWCGVDVLLRIGDKKMFKPTIRNPMCKDSLACCLSSLEFITRFNHVITKSIKETSI